MISTSDKYSNLIEALLERTVAGVQSWAGTSSDGIYSTRLGKYTVHIGLKSDWNSDQEDVVVTIFGEHGEPIDEFTDVHLQDATPRVSEFGTYYQLMSELHRRAGRDASGAERVLDELLSTLGIPPEAAQPRKLRAPVPKESTRPDDDLPF
jgi:hypothetical protein